MKNWRYWDELIFKFPLHAVLGIKSILNGLKPYHLVKANPGLPQGGIGDASKYDINIQFHSDYMLPFIKLEGNKTIQEKQQAIQNFITKEKTNYPIVLKPDGGWAGKGIAIVNNKTEEKKFLTGITEDYLAQAYCDWPEEYGVFYYKLAGKPHIYSINLKKVPTITGDGKHTIKQLIKKEKKERLLELIDKRLLKTIPQKGETVPLTKIYNVGQGGEYEDKTPITTPALLKAVTKAVGDTKFYYGRFDVKTKDEAALKKGIFKIIEVNGTHSSSSNYFDPKYSFLDAYKIIHKQYDILLRIALEHKDEPMDLLPYRTFMKRVKATKKKLKKQQVQAKKYH